MKLSVVIPTYRRADLLARGLAALERQSLPRETFDVLVVDDGSPEPPRRVVEESAARGLPVRLVRKENGGLASARNLGAREASGEVLVFMDDDIEPCPGFLAAHLAAHEREDRVVALGSLPRPPGLPLTPFLAYLERVVHYDLFKRYGSAGRIPLPPLNGNSSVRRRHFEEAGGYDLVGFAGYGGEDTEMGYRLTRRGLRFVSVPEARGFHWHLKGYEAYRRDMFSSGQALVRIVRRHPEVHSRVNLDLVTARFLDLPWSKRGRRLVLRTLEALPSLVAAMERVLARTERSGPALLLYPLYLLASHYHFARGMRDALREGGPLPPGAA